MIPVANRAVLLAAGLLLCCASCGGEPHVEPADQTAADQPAVPDVEQSDAAAPAIAEEPPPAEEPPATTDAGAPDVAAGQDTAEPEAELEPKPEPKPEPKKVSRGRAVISYASAKGAVTFKHRKHQGKAKCRSCHHKKEKGVTPEKCRACHGKSASPLKKALHSKCKGCHKAKGLPITCDSCHGA
jgi:hypothetical protein